jgi:cation diffusion facilitator CzcD-associated flavoprotein CzcO
LAAQHALAKLGQQNQLVYKENAMSTALSDQAQSEQGSEVLDVLLVGAGFSGLYLLDRLRNQGFNVSLFEAGAGLGGVWHWNCYPGARVDSPCWIYQFSREKLWREWNWSELYPGFEEMRAYFEFVDKKLDLSHDIRFGTWVRAAEFDNEQRHWLVQAEGSDSGPVTARAKFLLVCTGFAAKPYLPSIEGLDSFRGEWHHTAHWPQTGVDFRGKRVGVVGTGASGIQVAQEAAREAAHLTVFQRTPNLCLPMQQRKLDEKENQHLKESYQEFFGKRPESFAGMEYDVNPKSTHAVSTQERNAFYEELWQFGGFKFWLGSYEDMLSDEAANRAAYDFWRDKVRARIQDPVVAETLAPTEPPHPFGVKRPSLEQWFYDIFNDDHVELVDIKESPIERVTPSGIKTRNGEHELDHKLDILVMATGFDAVTGGLTQIDIRGTDGASLKEKWANGVRTYQGLSNAGFPNMMVTYGPQAPTAFCNGPTSAEYQGEYIVECLKYLRERGLTRIEATPEAEEAWRKQCLELADMTLFPQADSWYMGANIPGKVRELLMYPGGLPLYLQELRESAEKGYAGYVLD